MDQNANENVPQQNGRPNNRTLAKSALSDIFKAIELISTNTSFMAVEERLEFDLAVKYLKSAQKTISRIH